MTRVTSQEMPIRAASWRRRQALSFKLSLGTKLEKFSGRGEQVDGNEVDLVVFIEQEAPGNVHAHFATEPGGLYLAGDLDLVEATFCRFAESALGHHRMPESEADPDFCPTNNRSVLAWLVRFMRNYLNAAQLSRLVLVLTVLLLAAQPHQSQPLITVSVVFLLPLLISTAQLFFVGTYLPHRKEHKQISHQVSIKSLNLHPFVSLLACYHFGYHREHHNHPKAPWFLLPELRAGRLAH